MRTATVAAMVSIQLTVTKIATSRLSSTPPSRNGSAMDA